MANGNGHKTAIEQEKEARSGKIPAFKRFTTKQYHFWTLVKDRRMTQRAAWRAINPNSKSSDETADARASDLMRKIRDKIQSDDEWLQILDMGPSRIFRVLEEAMSADKPIIRGDRVVMVPDHRTRVAATKEQAEILGIKKLRIEGEMKIQHDTTEGFTTLVEDAIDELNNGNGTKPKTAKNT